MSTETKKSAGPYTEWDERREKIRELIKERMQTDDSLLSKEKKKKTGIEGQLEASDEKLRELLEFGDELVTNIKVAGEMREIQRRNFEDVRRKALLSDLSNESTEAIAKFNNITEKWSELKNYKEPVAMFNQLEKQKERIAELMASKDDVIEKCQQEINRVSDKYYADQEHQASEICNLVERIDSQVELIKQAYRHHLDLLQDAIEEERLKIAQNESARWIDVFDTMQSNELRKREIEKEKEVFYQEEIEKICREQQEITRDTRIRLDRDAEALQLELRSTQNNVLMNSEKLDYNYQVLQKRNEENVIINNQQKRRVAKFKEMISALKGKVQTIKGKAEMSIKKMTSEVEKLYSNISELEKKSQQFLQANEKKYQSVWNINFLEACSLTNRIYEIDRLLHEQQLGVTWEPQFVKGLQYNAVDGITFGKNMMSSTVEKTENLPIIKVEQKGKTFSHNLDETRLLRNILRKIADRCGFLIEEKLFEILEPYTDDEKCLVRIDNIFNALKISEYNDVTSLTEYFLPYAWCPNCSNDFSTENFQAICEQPNVNKQGSLTEEEQESVDDESTSLSIPDICTTSTDSRERNIDVILLQKTQKVKCEIENDKQKTCSNHFLVIQSPFVITALRNFTENYLQNKKGSNLGNLNSTKMKGYKTFKPAPKESIHSFWSNFLNVMPDEKQKLWKTLEHGLDHYLDVLKEREQLDIECEFLRRQNLELRHLLKKHIPNDF